MENEEIEVRELAEVVYESMLDLCMTFALSEKQKAHAVLAMAALEELRKYPSAQLTDTIDDHLGKPSDTEEGRNQ